MIMSTTIHVSGSEFSAEGACVQNRQRRTVTERALRSRQAKRLVDHPRGPEGMVVVLKTESEDMKFFFQGRDDLKVLLYQESLVPNLDILRVDAVSLLFECCAGVTDLVVIGHGATPKRTTIRGSSAEAS